VLVLVLVLVLGFESGSIASRTSTSTRTSTKISDAGRATVPAKTGRHGGRPYVIIWTKFLSSIRLAVFWPEAALVWNYMKI